MILISSWSRLCPILWSPVLSREWRCCWSSADRRCSNYIWVVDNLIAYYGASYIRDLTVGQYRGTRNQGINIIGVQLYCNQFLVCREEEFQLTVPFQCWEMKELENSNSFFFSEKFSTRRVNWGITVKPICNDHLYNKIYYLWFIQ